VNDFCYSSEIASTGHTAEHAPQLMQVFASMTRLSSFSLMALTGHSPSQDPQLMHASEILYAIPDSFSVDIGKNSLSGDKKQVNGAEKCRTPTLFFGAY